MLTSDREVNRDFDVNNLFLNLDFQHQEETFEYKWPLLDHPSNYQMIVTKLLTRTTLPYIKLHESKKRNKEPPLEYNDYIVYDYIIKLRYTVCTNVIEETRYYTTFQLNQNLIKYNNSYKTKLYDASRIVPEARAGMSVQYFFDYCDNGEEYIDSTPYWYDSKSHRDIYSLEQIYQMINCTLYKLTQTYVNLPEEYPNDLSYRTRYRLKGRRLIFIKLENNVPSLWIDEEFLNLIYSQSGTNPNNPERYKYELFFSKNLFRFLKGLHVEPSMDYENEDYCVLNITQDEWKDARIEMVPVKYIYFEGTVGTNIEHAVFRVFTGERINIMEVSDYIGLAIASGDFPIKEQIYPNFSFDFNKDFFTQNRRRYIPPTEKNIVYVRPQSLFSEKFVKQNINDQVKYSTGDKILFVKYFDPKTEDLNAICYENNNISTTLKMDLMNVMPLKKFTLKLFLIDRYNNFEPLHPKIEGFDDVIKLQLLFTRIKGTEKENRNFIETKIPEPEKFIFDLADLDNFDNESSEPENENEPVITNELEITNEPEILPDIKLVSVPAITKEVDKILPDISVIPVPAINTEQDSDSEDDIEAPPEKRIYLGDENEDSENENELY